MLARLPSPSQSIFSASFFRLFLFPKELEETKSFGIEFLNQTANDRSRTKRKQQLKTAKEERRSGMRLTQRLEHRPLGFVIAQKHPFEVHERGGAGTGLAKRAQCIGITRAEGGQWGQMKKDGKS